MNKKIEKLENNSIPVNIADMIIDEIPAEMWSNPNNKFCYASIVDSYIIDSFINRLNVGLQNIIIDDVERINHILNNMIYGIALDKYSARLTKAITKINNIFVKNITQDDLTDMPKFDYIIQNPPYNGNLHLEFFKKGLELLSENGKMTIIEPARFYLELREDTKDYINIYKPLLTKHKNNIYKVIIEMLSFDFEISNEIPCSITFIDKSKNTNGNIHAIICGEDKGIIDIFNCNLIGDRKIINSIFNKISNLYPDTLDKHVDKLSKKDTAAYIKYQAKILMNVAKHFYTGNRYGDYNNLGNFIEDKDNNLIIFRPYVDVAFFKNREIYNTIQQDMQNFVVCDIYDTYEENKKALNNFKHFIYNTKVGHFICISLTLGKNNTAKKYLPFIIKEFNDNDFYKYLTKEEITLIEHTNKKFNRISPWFKRYATGDTTITTEEINKYLYN